MHPALFTLGYEGLTIEAFIARLQAAQTKTVVDVCDLPLSRKKGYSKTAFRTALSAHGITYLHAPALGCPKPIRNQYKMDGNWQTYTGDFLKPVGWADGDAHERPNSPAKFAFSAGGLGLISRLRPIRLLLITRLIRIGHCQPPISHQQAQVVVRTQRKCRCSRGARSSARQSRKRADFHNGVTHFTGWMALPDGPDFCRKRTRQLVQQGFALCILLVGEHGR